MFSTILHANDGSEHADHALTMAIAIAKQNNSELHMISVEEIDSCLNSLKRSARRGGQRSGDTTLPFSGRGHWPIKMVLRCTPTLWPAIRSGYCRLRGEDPGEASGHRSHRAFGAPRAHHREPR